MAGENVTQGHPTVFAKLIDANNAAYPADSTLPSEVVGNIAHAGTDSGKPVKIGGVATSSAAGPTAATTGQRVDAWFTVNGAQVIGGAQITGTRATNNANLVAPAASGGASTRLWAEAPFIQNGASWDPQVKANAASRIASAAASVNATSAKASAGEVYRAFGYNAKASVIYLKVYNKATAPTVGTDTPVLTIPIAASAVFNIDIGGGNGFYLGTGIAYGFTTDAADNGTTALLAGDILGFTLSYS